MIKETQPWPAADSVPSPQRPGVIKENKIER